MFNPAPDEDRILVARLLSALITTGVVALIGLLAGLLWGRRTGLIALALAAVFLPLTLVGAAVMSEGLFALILLTAVVLAVRFRETDPYPAPGDRARRPVRAAGSSRGPTARVLLLPPGSPPVGRENETLALPGRRR